MARKWVEYGWVWYLVGVVMARKWVEYGWVWYLALGLLWLVVGLSQLFNPADLLEDDAQHITGMSLSELEASSPEATKLIFWLIQSLGNLKISWSLFLIAITLTGYRKGEKWAWYTLWLAPAILVCSAIFNTIFLGDVNEVLQWIPITTISVLGLLLPYRKFFPKQPRSQGNIT
jgi:hypothetical protein